MLESDVMAWDSVIYKSEKIHDDHIFCLIVISEKQDYTAYEILSRSLSVDKEIFMSLFVDKLM